MSPLCSEQAMYAPLLSRRKIRREKAALKIQAAYRGYLFRRIEREVRYNTAGYDHHHHIFAYY